MNLVFELSEWLEKLETPEKPFTVDEMKELEHILMLVRKSLMDLKKENENYYDQITFLNNRVKKNDFYQAQLERDNKALKEKK